MGDADRTLSKMIDSNAGNNKRIAEHQARLERHHLAASPHFFAILVLLVWCLVGIVCLVTNTIAPGDTQLEKYE